MTNSVYPIAHFLLFVLVFGLKLNPFNPKFKDLSQCHKRVGDLQFF